MSDYVPSAPAEATFTVLADLLARVPASAGGPFDKLKNDPASVPGKGYPSKAVFDAIRASGLSVPWWDVAASYKTGAVVLYGAAIYVALADTAGDQPDATPAKWKDMTAGGGGGGPPAAHAASHTNGTDQIADAIPTGSPGAKSGLMSAADAKAIDDLPTTYLGLHAKADSAATADTATTATTATSATTAGHATTADSATTATTATTATNAGHATTADSATTATSATTAGSATTAATATTALGVTETGGPTALAMAAVTDGQVLARSGATVTGKSVGSTAGTLCAGDDKRLLAGVECPAGQRIYYSQLPTAAASFLTISASAYFVFVGRTVVSLTPKYVELYLSAIAAGTVGAELGLFSSVSPPQKSSLSLTKITSTNTLDSLTSGLGVKRNTNAFSTAIAAGTYLWAGCRFAFGTTQPTVWGHTLDMGEGAILATTSSGAFSLNNSFTGSTIASSTTATPSAQAPMLRITLD